MLFRPDHNLQMDKAKNFEAVEEEANEVIVQSSARQLHRCWRMV